MVWITCLILTAPIYCRGSICEQVIGDEMLKFSKFVLIKKQNSSTYLNFEQLNYSFNYEQVSECLQEYQKKKMNFVQINKFAILKSTYASILLHLTHDTLYLLIKTVFTTSSNITGAMIHMNMKSLQFFKVCFSFPILIYLIVQDYSLQ